MLGTYLRQTYTSITTMLSTHSTWQPHNALVRNSVKVSSDVGLMSLDVYDENQIVTVRLLKQSLSSEQAV